MHATEHLKEAARLMTVCNSCRYCEGLCAVFPAMERRRVFSDSDLTYLANLCHGCAACYVDCQFTPPHEFQVNVPATLARVRGDSYGMFAWPGALGTAFQRNGLVIATVTAIIVALFLVAFVYRLSPEALLSSSGDFYRLVPHTTLATLFGGAGLYALLALLIGFRNFWTGTAADSVRDGTGVSLSLWRAIKDGASLRYLDGGGVGCYRKDERPTDRRRLFHHFTFYGFLLCFAATCTGTIYHYGFGWIAPYGWNQLPKVLGTLGGLGLVIGPIGLLAERLKRAPEFLDAAKAGMDVAFLCMIFLTGATGLALMLLRQTPAMGILLAVHLGVVFSLFLTMPYGKFVHGIYRFGALLRYAMERRADEKGEGNVR